MLRKILNLISRPQNSLVCSVISLLIFLLVITGISIGFIPLLSHGPNEFVDICLWTVVLIALLGLSAGVTALLKSGQSDYTKEERQWVRAGITLSLLLSVPLLIGLTFEYIERSSRGKLGRHTAVIESLRTIHMRQADFLRLNGRFATLKEMADLGLIDMNYEIGKPVYRYIYSESDISSDTYCVHADRESGTAGYRDYNISESGEIRYIESETSGTVPRNAGIRLWPAPE